MTSSLKIEKRTAHADVIVDDDSWWTHGCDEGVVQRALDALWMRVSENEETVELSALLTDDARIRELNQQFRGKDQATNVLSFPSGDDGYIGDIALGAETVVHEASDLGIPVQEHVTHLVVHGTLHLMGYDHQNSEDAEQMESLEVLVLEDLGIADPYKGRDLNHTDDAVNVKRTAS